MNPDLHAPDIPPAPTNRSAAFFGLDRTLIPGSSLFLLAQGLHGRDLFATADMIRFAWQQLVFRAGGPDLLLRVETSRTAALEFVQGRHRPDVKALAKEIADERIVPQVYPDMAQLIEQHRSAGILTFVATAAPAELAEIVAEGLGMTGGLGTCAEVDGTGRYSGRLAGSVLQGEAKATAVEAHASAAGIDLSASVAYSDSINDLPMLELVGNPEVVNPDRRLRRVAGERGWPVHQPRPSARAGGGGGGEEDGDAHVVAHVARRLEALELESAIRHAGQPARRGRNHRFTAEDPDGLVRELEQSGRFRRDSRLGRIFHPGKISLREVSPTHSLHITLEEGNTVSAHVDRFSPLAPTQGEEGCRYSLTRIAAHNVTGMAADLARLVRRRRPRARRRAG